MDSEKIDKLELAEFSKIIDNLYKIWNTFKLLCKSIGEQKVLLKRALNDWNNNKIKESESELADFRKKIQDENLIISNLKKLTAGQQLEEKKVKAIEKQRPKGILKKTIKSKPSIAIIIIVIILASSYGGYKTFKGVDDPILNSFPDDIPGAKSVDKYPTEGAKHALVHIRQVHLIDEELTEYELKRIKASQEDIYKILTYLIENNGLKEVYIEGLTPKTQEALEKITEESKKTQKILETAKKEAYERLESIIEANKNFINGYEDNIKSDLNIAIGSEAEGLSPEEYTEKYEKLIEKEKAELEKNEEKLRILTQEEQEEKISEQPIEQGAAEKLEDEGKMTYSPN